MMTLHCDIVTAEREIFSGRVRMMVFTGTLGEIGVLPGHAPLLTGIKPGPVRLQLENGEEQVFFASGGFVEVQPGGITILADTAERAEDLNEAEALEAQERAARDMANRQAEFEFGVAASQLAEASARLRALDRLRDRRG